MKKSLNQIKKFLDKLHNGKNNGMTLVETMTACVIITILMTILIQGILAASNWFAKSSEIKDQGEKTANRVEGAYDSEVTKNTKQLPVSLQAQEAGNPSVGLPQTENTQNEYAYGDTKFYTIDSDVADYVPDPTDPVYEPTRTNVTNMTTIVTNIAEIINTEGFASAGFANQWQVYDNDTWTAMILYQLGGSWPTVSDEFKTKYNLAGGGFGDSLIIRPYVFGPSPAEVLFYITDSTGGNQWVPLLIYDPAAKVWLRVPKDAEGANFNNYKKYFLVKTTDWNSCGSYSYFETDNYKYHHANNTDIVNSIKPENVPNVLGFIRDETNGWEIMYPDE